MLMQLFRSNYAELTKGEIMHTQENVQTEHAKSVEVETCERCGNVYKLIWLKESNDYNDFGFRHCPFSGLLMDRL